MAELSLFYDAVLQDDGTYDRAYTSADWAKYFENIFRNGVMMSVGEALRVTAADSVGMRVVVKAGSASLKGYQYINTSAFAVPIDVASSTQDRTDSIVVRHDMNARQAYVAVKKGNVTVERTPDVFEIQLATVRVPRNSTAITADLITDKRPDEKVCGYSTPFENVSVSGMEDKYTAMLNTIIENMNQYTEEQKKNLEADMQAVVAKGNEYIQEAQKDWQDFLATVSNDMEGDVALNLQKKIAAVTPDQLLFTKNDLPFDYPIVEVLALINGFGITPLGEENWLGDIPETIPNKIGYPTKNAITVKVPTDWKMSSPKISEVNPFVYLLNEGNKSVQIKIKGSK
ncbi:structural protein [Enterococcus faecalis]|uniref:structural protein n=1 Tax=Enterococcus faecalis TaxID=1351 RepID=UPI0018997CB9|nr:structural protein [Enterococcus faecalis]